jgi:hypothetical protein
VSDAQKAGLVKPGGGWTKWPKDMCFARALSRLARQLFSDVIGIGYVEGEIKASDEEITVPDDVPMEITYAKEDADNDLKKLLELFDKEDRFLVMDYINVVMKHFEWTQDHCVKKFLEDKDLLGKFTKWKNKIKVDNK